VTAAERATAGWVGPLQGALIVAADISISGMKDSLGTAKTYAPRAEPLVASRVQSLRRLFRAPSTITRRASSLISTCLEQKSDMHLEFVPV
jgi:hypothetical protein